MPTVKGKKYPYTKAGKAAAKTARKKGRKGLKKGTDRQKEISKGLKGVAKVAGIGAVVGAGAGKVLKGLKKGALKRTPAMIRKQKAAMERAKKKRKAGKGYQK